MQEDSSQWKGGNWCAMNDKSVVQENAVFRQVRKMPETEPASGESVSATLWKATCRRHTVH